MKYRIPFRMFFKWFIPHKLWQSGVMAVVFFVPIAIAWYLLTNQISPLLVFGLFVLAFAAGQIYGYHHHIRLKDVAAIICVGALLAITPLDCEGGVKATMWVACVLGAYASFRFQRNSALPAS